MKTLSFALLVSIAFTNSAICAGPANVGTINSISVMGSLWGNDNRGGIVFWTSNPNALASDVSYFIIRPTDVALKMFLSELLIAKQNGWSIIVQANKTNLEPSTNKYEYDVVAIVLP